MQQLVDFEFQWWRDVKGYELVDTPAPKDPDPIWIEGQLPPGQILFPGGFPAFRKWVDPSPQKALLPYRIVRLGGALSPYWPLGVIDDIFRAYVNLEYTREAILEFVDRYGPLTLSGLHPAIGEGLAEIVAAVQHLNEYITARLSDDGTATRRLLASGELGVTGIVPKLSYDIGTRSPKLRFHIPDLLTALWFHLMQSFNSGTSLRRCEWEKCGIVFEAGAGTGRRADSKFCSDQHRIAYHSAHRTLRAPIDKAPPRRRGRPRRTPA